MIPNLFWYTYAQALRSASSDVGAYDGPLCMRRRVREATWARVAASAKLTGSESLAWRHWASAGSAWADFLFLYFIFSFFTKIYFCFQNLQEYTPAALLPGGRDLVALLRGGRDFSIKIYTKNLRWSPWRTGHPTAGRPAPKAARQPGGRPCAWLPRCLVVVWCVRTRDVLQGSFCL